MAKISIVSRPPKREGGDLPIYVRISHRNVDRYLSLGIAIPSRHWNARVGAVRKSHDEHWRINRRLSEVMERAQTALMELQTSNTNFTPDQLKAALREAIREDAKASGPDFLAFAKDTLTEYEQRAQVGSYVRLSTIINKLGAYHEKTHRASVLPFLELTPAYLLRYMDYLSRYHGNGPNTIMKNMKGIRTIYYRAIKEGLIKQQDNPFFQLKLSERTSAKIWLTTEEIDRLNALPLQHGSALWHTRNYFMFSLYLAGIRFGDLCELQWSQLMEVGNQWRLVYRTGRSGRNKSVLLVPQAQALLVRYTSRKNGANARLFPLLDGYDTSTPTRVKRAIASQNAMVNERLKELQGLAKITTPISFQIARNSFAGMARNAGWPLSDISQAMGHSTLSETRRYLASFDQGALDDKLKSLF